LSKWTIFLYSWYAGTYSNDDFVVDDDIFVLLNKYLEKNNRES
jgi:hypothetical protein